MSEENHTLFMANNSTPVRITKIDFHKYLIAQQEGKYNMLSSAARRETGLSEEKYYTIINYYTQLKKIHCSDKVTSDE
jgi:hypothetical protein